MYARGPRRHATSDLQPLTRADTSNSLIKYQDYAQAAEQDDDADDNNKLEDIEVVTRPNEYPLQSRKPGGF